MPEVGGKLHIPELLEYESSESFRGGNLIAVETVNQAGRHMAARKLLAGPPVTRAAVEAAGWDLRALLAAQQG